MKYKCECGVEFEHEWTPSGTAIPIEHGAYVKFDNNNTVEFYRRTACSGKIKKVEGETCTP